MPLVLFQLLFYEWILRKRLLFVFPGYALVEGVCSKYQQPNCKIYKVRYEPMAEVYCYACEDKFYLNQSFKCVSCPSFCKNCTNSTQCIQPQPGYSLISKEKLSSTLTSLLTTFLTNKILVQCPNSCRTCLTQLNIKSVICTSCHNRYFLNSSNQCQKCGDTNCLKCMSPFVCTQCEFGSKLIDSRCYPMKQDQFCIIFGKNQIKCQKCLYGYAYNPSSQLCQYNLTSASSFFRDYVCAKGSYLQVFPTHPFCQPCSSIDKCTSCYKSLCHRCQQGYYPTHLTPTQVLNNMINKCLPCKVLNCLTCRNSFTCQRCINGYFAHLNAFEYNTTEYNTSSQSYTKTQMTQKFQDSCIKCNANCKTCYQTPHQCLSCFDGYQLSTINNHCVGKYRIQFQLIFSSLQKYFKYGTTNLTKHLTNYLKAQNSLLLSQALTQKDKILLIQQIKWQKLDMISSLISPTHVLQVNLVSSELRDGVLNGLSLTDVGRMNKFLSGVFGLSGVEGIVKSVEVIRSFQTVIKTVIDSAPNTPTTPTIDNPTKPQTNPTTDPIVNPPPINPPTNNPTNQNLSTSTSNNNNSSTGLIIGISVSALSLIIIIIMILVIKKCGCCGICKQGNQQKSDQPSDGFFKRVFSICTSKKGTQSNNSKYNPQQCGEELKGKLEKGDYKENQGKGDYKGKTQEKDKNKDINKKQVKVKFGQNVVELQQIEISGLEQSKDQIIQKNNYKDKNCLNKFRNKMQQQQSKQQDKNQQPQIQGITGKTGKQQHQKTSIPKTQPSQQIHKSPNKQKLNNKPKTQQYQYQDYNDIKNKQSRIFSQNKYFKVNNKLDQQKKDVKKYKSNKNKNQLTRQFKHKTIKQPKQFTIFNSQSSGSSSNNTINQKMQQAKQYKKNQKQANLINFNSYLNNIDFSTFDKKTIKRN